MRVTRYEILPMGTRYSSPTGIHGLRRRVVRWWMKRWTPPVTLSTTPLPIFGVHRILVCRTSHSLGNSVLLTPLLAEIERVYPGAEVDIVTQSPMGAELYGRWPAVREVMCLPSRFPPHLPWLFRVLGQMRSKTYDLAIDPDPQSKTARLLLRLARATYKLGYLGPEKQGDVTHGIDVDGKVRHVGQVPVHLLRAVIDRRIDVPFPPADIRLDDDEMSMARETMRKVIEGRGSTVHDTRIIGIFANATGAKRLDRSWWFAMLDQLESLLPTHTFVEFTPADGRSLLENRYPTLHRGSLRKMAACAAQLDGFVSVDSGPMHLAWAAGTMTFAIFNGTDISEWGPYGANAFVIDKKEHTPQDIAGAIARRWMADYRVA